MTDLPAGWRTESVNDLARGGLFTDGDWVESKDQDPDGTVRLTQLADVGVGEFRDRSNRWMREDQAKRLGCTFLQPGDVLIARMPDPIGRACLVPENIGRAVTAVDVAILRPARDDLDPRYLMWAINSPHVHECIASLQSGTTRKRVSRKNLATVGIPVPSLTEQERIVEVLEDYLSRLDAGTDYLNVAAQRLSIIGDAMFASAGELVGLEPVRLDSLIAEKLSNGRSVPTADSGFPVLRLTALKNGRIDLGECKIGRWTAEEASPFLVAQDDVLVARGNGSIRLVGRAAMVVDEPDAVAFPDTMIRIRPDHTKVLPEYLSLAWNSRVVRRQIESTARTTAGIYKVSQKDLQKILVPTPDLPAQQTILERMGEHNAAVQRLSRQVEWEQARAGSLRRAILAAAFSGRLTGAPDAEQVEGAAVTSAEAAVPEGALF
ncbi:restriction endonuclease subunit S [Streptomyces sp. NPDC006207]